MIPLYLAFITWKAGGDPILAILLSGAFFFGAFYVLDSPYSSVSDFIKRYDRYK